MKFKSLVTGVWVVKLITKEFPSDKSPEGVTEKVKPLLINPDPSLSYLNLNKPKRQLNL